jgi:GT2 family glycosyltransferase
VVNLIIAVLNYNTKELTQRCLKSVFENKPETDFEVWVVDNASTDDSLKIIKKNFPQINIIESDKNFGFAGGNNLVLKKIPANYYLLLNSDTEIKDRAVDKLLNFARDNEYSISSCRLLDKEGKFQPNAGELPKFSPLIVWLSGLDDIFRKFIYLPSYQERSEKFYQKDRSVGWVGGAAMLIEGNILKKLGYFDDKLFMYGEDVDFCFRASKEGLKVGWTKSAEIMHLGGGSLNQPKYFQWKGEFSSLIYIYKKYYGKFFAFILRLLMYFFIFIRIVSFSILGKLNYAQTYAKIFINF